MTLFLWLYAHLQILSCFVYMINDTNYRQKIILLQWWVNIFISLEELMELEVPEGSDERGLVRWTPVTNQWWRKNKYIKCITVLACVLSKDHLLTCPSRGDIILWPQFFTGGLQQVSKVQRVRKGRCMQSFGDPVYRRKKIYEMWRKHIPWCNLKMKK